MGGVRVLPAADPVAGQVAAALRIGDVDTLVSLLESHPGLGAAYVGSAVEARSLPHLLTDWPGHVPDAPRSLRLLVGAGADVDAPFRGRHAETPLHWAASCDDVAMVDALVDAGADLERTAGAIADGTPLTNARIYRQWAAARRLVGHGAVTTLHDEAALGLLDRLAARIEREPASLDDLGAGLWNACRGGQAEAAAELLAAGADLDWLAPWGPSTPLDAAGEAAAHRLVTGLRARGAHTAHELGAC